MKSSTAGTGADSARRWVAVADISVTAQGSAFSVRVRDGAVATSHTVTVPPELFDAVGWDRDHAEMLVRTSFEFLLEREPPTSILSSFSLDVIGSYFPEYRSEMKARAGHGP